MAQAAGKAFKAAEKLSYQSWCDKHGKKHAKLIGDLQQRGLGQEQIITYFEYENIALSQPGFCPLFAQNKKCHNLKYLNCFFCGCPYFIFAKEEGAKIQSRCAINARFGVQKSYNNQLHLDCSDCNIPHTYQFVRKNFTYNWFSVMKMCKKETH
ncbi:MAG: hypothetical protein ACQERK_02795 [Campylobacterota bacterium]